MFQTLKDLLSLKDLRKKILYTLLIIILFSIGTYIVVPGINKIAFNIDVTQEGSKINIFSLDYFVEYYSQQYENIVANDIYDKKPILYGEMIVRDEQGRLGINDLKNKSIVGAKYSNIQFDEETKEYYVTTTENQIGLINLQGNIIISPQYDEINRISKDMDLYVVKRNDKYGIINEKNEIVVYIELDQIGLDSYDSYGEVKNKYLLYDSVIPVMYNEKWGLVDKKGEVVIPLEYDSFGTAGTKKEKDQYPVLLIEDYKSLIVQKDEYYGILNYKGETLIPCALTDVYYKISSGKKVYNMTYLENTMDVLDYLKEKYIKENANQKDVEEVTEEDYDEEW